MTNPGHPDAALARAIGAAWEQPAPDLRGLLVDLWRRRLLIIMVAALVFSGTAAVILTRERVWQAEGKIAIDGHQPQIVALEKTLAVLNDGALETEIQVLRSHELVRATILDLGLHATSDFNPALRSPGVLGLAKRRLSDAAQAWLPELWQRTTINSPSQDSFLMPAVEELLENLQVEPVGQSWVIAISLESTSRTRVADVVNALIDQYLVTQTIVRRDLMSKVSSDLGAHITGLEERVRQSEQALEVFRAKSGLTQGRDISVLSQRLVELTNELARATADRAAADGRLAQVRKGEAALLAVPEVLEAEHIQSMLAEEAVLAAQAAEDAKRYGERHPVMIEVRGRLAGLQAGIAAAMLRVEDSLRAAVVAGRAREQALRDAIAEQERLIAERSPDEAKLRQLERAATADRMLLESLQNRTREIGAAALFSRPDARVVTRARVPLEPRGPAKGLLLAFAFPLSFGVGGIAALAVIMFDRTPRRFDQLETAIGVPVTSAIPWMPGHELALGACRVNRSGTAGNPAPYSLLLAAMRDLYAALLLQGGGQRQAILFTSAVPDEGKTSTAMCFAQMLACTGRKVLFIDGDLRRPTAHQRLGLTNRPGLGECLAGMCRLDQAIQHHLASGLSLLAAGAVFVDVSHLGRDGSFARILEWARRDYDVVVIDSAPVLSAPESRLLARLADRTVFLVRWSRTPIDVVQRGLRMLADSGATLAGVTLSMVGRGELAHYHYSRRYARIASADRRA